jgi:hypothetical protein
MVGNYTVHKYKTSKIEFGAIESIYLESPFFPPQEFTIYEDPRDVCVCFFGERPPAIIHD